MSNAWFFISFIACYCGPSTGFSTHSRGFMNPYPRIAPCSTRGPTGDPLFLTPYIDSGHPEVARSAARVPPLSNQIQSYSGYLTVDKRKGSNLFFWYFPPTNADVETTPVALWLQGGPGGSSMFGLLSENGPITFDNDLKPTSKPHSWSEFAHMIYIDSPVGTGFSFTEDEQGYATNEDQIAQNLYYALVQFFQIFPELKPRPFFLTGESYAGKYVPALAHVIHVNNANGILINLQGVAIGNGLVDPENMMKYSDYLYEHGLVDRSGRQKFKNVEDQIVDDIKRGKFNDATVGFESIFKLLSQSLAPLDVYNYVHNDDSKFDDKMSAFFCQPSVRKRIHVGNLTFNDGVTVQRHLINDMMRTVKQWFVEALYNYRVLVYNGQLDIVVAYPLTVNFLDRLDWSGAARYKTAERRKWMVDGKLAGFVKNVDNFTEILVRDAGHMVPTDQPKWAQRMMKNFFYNVPF